MNTIDAYRKRRNKRLAARGFRLDDDDENGGGKRGGGHGNTKIPYGLCQREGIEVKAGWTPKDAWDALAGKGYSASEVYKELKETGKVAPKTSKEAKRPTKKEALKEIQKLVGDGKYTDEKAEKLENYIKGLPIGTRVNFPDSWTSDDGTKNYAIYEGEDRWRLHWGRKKSDSTIMASNEMAQYMLGEDESERAKLASIPAEKKKEDRHTFLPNDGTIVGHHAHDFHNTHVSNEERAAFKGKVKEAVEDGTSSYGDAYRKSYAEAGDCLIEEIKRRQKSRRKDKENAPINNSPQVDDIYDALRDIRQFGKPDDFDFELKSDLDKEKTDAIIKEAFNMFPTDWLEGCKDRPSIRIIDGAGRACCVNHKFIYVYTKTNELGMEGMELGERGVMANLTHELGHFVEENNDKLGVMARGTLFGRAGDAAYKEEDLEPGYRTWTDSFFNRYMGKIYPYDSTEITSVLMQNLCYFNPFETMSGKRSGKRDKESLQYILGILAGL